MKTRLSSRMTFFYKFIFPIIFLMFVFYFFYNDWQNYDLNLQILFISSFSILGILICWFLCRLKTIYIHDEKIHISNFFKNVVIDRNDIAYISHFLFSGPPIIWIYFKNKTPFGNYIIFTPYFKFFTFFSHPVLKYIEPIQKVKPLKKNNIFDIIIVVFILFWIILWTFLLLSGLIEN